MKWRQKLWMAIACGLLATSISVAPVQAAGEDAPMTRSVFKSQVETLLQGQIQEHQAMPETMTRKEAAVWIADLLPPMNRGIAGGIEKFYPFTDTPNITSDERESIHLLYDVGIMVGDGSGHFKPNQWLTTWEANAILTRVSKLVGKTN